MKHLLSALSVALFISLSSCHPRLTLHVDWDGVTQYTPDQGSGQDSGGGHGSDQGGGGQGGSSDHGGGDGDQGGGGGQGGGDEGGDPLVIEVTSSNCNSLDVSSFGSKQLYLIKVNSDLTEDKLTGTASAGTTGSLKNASFVEPQDRPLVLRSQTKPEGFIGRVHVPPRPVKFPTKEELAKINASRLLRAGGGEYKRDFAVGDDTKFYVDGSPKPFLARYVGEHCIVWLNLVGGSYTYIKETNACDNVGKMFDKIFNQETALMGNFYISTQDTANTGFTTGGDKVNILIYDMDHYGGVPSRYTGGTGGYFWGSDMYDADGFNGCAVLHLNAAFWECGLARERNIPSVFSVSETYNTLAHEFNHMLNFINIEIVSAQLATWYTELLAACAEVLMRETMGISVEESIDTGRLSEFLPYTRNGFTHWGGPYSSRSETLEYRCYGAIWSFGAFIMRNYGGAALIHSLATNDKWGSQNRFKEALKTAGYPNETLQSLVLKWPQIMTNVGGTVSGLPTLNKTDNKIVSSYTFGLPAVNMASVEPDLVASSYVAKDDPYDVWSSGFTVHKIASNHPAKLQFNMPTNTSVKMYVVAGE